MISEKRIKDFIIELKIKGARYESMEKDGEKFHWLGSSKLTNDHMRTMCSTFFEDDYNLLTDPEKRKIRDRIFDTIRGELNG